MTKHLTLTETAEFLRRNDDYLLLSHRMPDGDTVGCCAALCLALRSMGKRAAVYANPQFTPRFLPYLEGLLTHEVRGMPVCLDVASPSMLPQGMETVTAALCIDHHGSNSGYALRSHVEGDKAACGEIVTALLEELGVALDRRMAEAVYLAVSTDTGCFRYANVTANTFRVAAACLEAGAEAYPINRVMFEIKRKARLELEAYLVQTMELFAGGRAAIFAIPAEVTERLGLTEDDLDGIAGFGRTVEGVEIAVLLREPEPGEGKVSVRTGPGYDASRICARFGGGGHAGAAGGSVPGGIPAARAAVLRSLAEEVDL